MKHPGVGLDIPANGPSLKILTRDDLARLLTNMYILWKCHACLVYGLAHVPKPTSQLTNQLEVLQLFVLSKKTH